MSYHFPILIVDIPPFGVRTHQVPSDYDNDSHHCYGLYGSHPCLCPQNEPKAGLYQEQE